MVTCTVEAYLQHALSDNKSCLCLEVKKKSEVIVGKYWILLPPGPVISKEYRRKKKKEKAVVNQTFVGIPQNVISKLKNGSWQNSWWIGLMSEERNKTQHMSKPAVLGPSMIIPRRIAWVQLERATVPCFSSPQGHCWEAGNFWAKLNFACRTL